MTQPKYRSLSIEQRKSAAEQTRRCMADVESGYTRFSNKLFAYLQGEFAVFIFIAMQCQKYGVYQVNASEVGRVTGMHRTFVWNTIRKLLDMGFVKYFDGNEKNKFVTINVKTIDMFNERTKDLQFDDVIKLRDDIGCCDFAKWNKTTATKNIKKNKSTKNKKSSYEIALFD